LQRLAALLCEGSKAFAKNYMEIQMSIKELREAIDQAYELSKGLEESTLEMEEKKRAVIDDLRSAQFALNMYEESTFVMTRVEVEVEATVTVLVKHKPNQHAGDYAADYVSDSISIDCEPCYVDINEVSASKTNIVDAYQSEDLDVTEDE
jgi:hypothetical protein